MLATGQFTNMIVSMVGRFTETQPAGDGSVGFQTSDGGTIRLLVEQMELPLLDPSNGPPYEIVGHAAESNGTVMVSIENPNATVASIVI